MRRVFPGRGHHALISATALGGFLAAATGAQAQVTPKAPADTPVIAEVVVTAQKQTERLQDVPITVQKVTSEQLTALNATKLLDVANITPGLTIVSQTGQPGSTTIDIRGISTADEASTTVATTVDDVPVNSSSSNAYAGLAGLDLMPYLIDAIEVLKGPQGTLYGASSLGGLLKYVTPTPSLTSTSGSVGAEISGVSHGDQLGNSVRGSFSTALIPDVLGVDLRVDHVFAPGYIDDHATGQKDFNHGSEDGALAGVLWKPTDRLTIKANAIVQFSDFHGVSSILQNAAGTAPADSYYAADYPLPNANRAHQNSQIYTLNATYDLGWAKLTSVTGYSHLQSSFALDISEASYDIYFGINAADKYTLITDKTTQEFRLSSPTPSKLSWAVGFFYTDETSTYREAATPYDKTTGSVAQAFTPFYFSAIDSSFKEYAGFANATYQILPQWDISVGGRYASNDQDGHGFGSGFLNGGPYDTGVLKTSDSAFTYAVDSRYHFNRDVMLYGRIASGYRAGGVNLTAGAPAAFQPDKTTNYEAGLKSEWFERKLLVNADLFYIDWSQIHILEREANLLNTFTGNVGHAVSKGIEFETHYQFVPSFRLGAEGAYIDATLQGADAAVGAVKGTRLPNSPRFTGSLFANYKRDLGGGYLFTADATWTYVGSRISDFPAAKPAGVLLKSYDALGLDAAVRKGPWKVSAFMTNAFDKQAFVTRRNFGAVILQPRTVGISVDRSF